MTTYRLFPSTSGPASPAAYTGPILLGVIIKATTGGTWFDGYWWWVCPTGQSTAAQKFALWQLTGNGVGTLIPGSVVTSGTLTAGQWNYVPLPLSLPLSIGCPYVACTGFNNSFPDTTNQFGLGQPYANGIVNGPLTAYSNQGAGLPAPFNTPQALFSTAGNDPSVTMPGSGNVADNFWMDVQIDTAPPFGTSYRLWPNQPVPPNTQLDSAVNFTLATEFKLSVPCQLNRIWFYSPPGVTQLPTEVGIWNVSGQTVMPGTHLTSPSWSGAAGAGWISCSFTGVTLPAGDYKTSVFNGAVTPLSWADNTVQYFDASGPGANGITTGPLSAPSLATATAPGQGTYHQGAVFAWPDTYTGTPFDAQTYWVDVEVTPPGGGLLMAVFP